jgi:predicted DNA-binding transcriptional regulator YafY
VSREKTERLLNLTIALLGTRNFLSKSQILRTVAGYGQAGESADRMFERDKEDLRELGIPLEVRAVDPLFDDEPGYRIDRDRYQLPPLQFTAREMSLLALAAGAWQQAALSGPANEGLRKLISSGTAPEGMQTENFAPHMRTTEAAFPAVWGAVRDGRAIVFDYLKAGDSRAQGREVEPWGLLSSKGHWYLVGRDRARSDVRVFRLSRISGSVRAFGPPQAVVIPEGTDVFSHVALLEPGLSTISVAEVLARPNAATALRRRASLIEEDRSRTDGEWERLRIPFSDVDHLARECAALGDRVIVEAPDEVRQRTLEVLRAARELARS